MDLKVSGTNFYGKQEILYGLTKASYLTQKMSLYRVAYVDSRMHMPAEPLKRYAQSVAAYLDMVFHDGEFNKSTIDSFTKQELKLITNNLKDVDTQHGTAKPMKDFTDIAGLTINEEHFPDTVIRYNDIKALLNKLSSFISK